MVDTSKGKGFARPASPVTSTGCARLYHVDGLPAFHFDEHSVTMLFTASLPLSGAGGAADVAVVRPELYLNMGVGDFEALLRRLVAIRAELVDAGVIARAADPAEDLD